MSETMNANITPDYARTADMNLFSTFEGVTLGEHVTVETDDGRTFEGELADVEIKLARDGWLDENALVAEFTRDDGHTMKVAQYEDGVSIRTETTAHVESESFTDYRNLNGSPDVASVTVEQDADEEHVDEEPRETCSNCGGEAVHTQTNTVNGWINEASAYESHGYECLNCGRRGARNEKGTRTGVVAAPPADDAETTTP